MKHNETEQILNDHVVNKSVFTPAKGKVFPMNPNEPVNAARIARDEFVKLKSVIIDNLTSFRRETPDGAVEEAWEYDPETDEMVNVTERVKAEEANKKPSGVPGWKGQKFCL